MRNKWLQHLLIIWISLSPLCYLAIVWPSIPPTVPIHFDSSFKPNDFADKSALVIIYLVVTAVSSGCYFLMQNINKIDPKRAAQPNSPIFNKLGIGIVLFITALNFSTIILSINHDGVMKYTVICLAGLMVAFLGSMMRNIQPNYFAGIKLPWTLSSNYNWRKTHQLAGKLWIAGGLLIALQPLVLPLRKHHIIITGVLVIIIIIPVAYSFILFRREMANPGIADEDNNNG